MIVSVTSAYRLARSEPERDGAVFLDIADLRDGHREPLSRSTTRHGKPGQALTLPVSAAPISPPPPWPRPPDLAVAPHMPTHTPALVALAPSRAVRCGRADRHLSDWRGGCLR